MTSQTALGQLAAQCCFLEGGVPADAGEEMQQEYFEMSPKSINNGRSGF